MLEQGPENGGIPETDLAVISHQPLSKADEELVRAVTRNALRFGHAQTEQVAILFKMGILSKIPDLANPQGEEYVLRGISNRNYPIFLRFAMPKDIWLLTAIDKRPETGQVIDRIRIPTV